jgi:hypothetical protein
VAGGAREGDCFPFGKIKKIPAYRFDLLYGELLRKAPANFQIGRGLGFFTPRY